MMNHESMSDSVSYVGIELLSQLKRKRFAGLTVFVIRDSCVSGRRKCCDGRFAKTYSSFWWYQRLPTSSLSRFHSTDDLVNLMLDICHTFCPWRDKAVHCLVWNASRKLFSLLIQVTSFLDLICHGLLSLHLTKDFIDESLLRLLETPWLQESLGVLKI